MTDFHNSSDADETSHDGTDGGGGNDSRPRDPHGGNSHGENSQNLNSPDLDSPDLDAQWSAFLASHADDVQALDASRTAKRFEKEAAKQDRQRHERQRKEAEEQFKQMARSEQGRGPRDFETSILDDAPDDHFTPPDPDGSLDHYTRTYLALLIVGLVLVVLGFVLPRFATVLESTGGMFLIIGILALVMRKR